jgi:hypothetical protein
MGALAAGLETTASSIMTACPDVLGRQVRGLRHHEEVSP